MSDNSKNIMQNKKMPPYYEMHALSAFMILDKIDFHL